MSQPISVHRQNFSLWHEIQLIAEGPGATKALSEGLEREA